jgi:DNA-binding NarL/FixJ family response regulator
VRKGLKLAPRELQVVLGILHEMTEKAVADELGIAETTVVEYLKRAYRHMGVHSRTAMATRVLHEIYVELERSKKSGPKRRKPPPED